jgi:hypothetical protein
MNSGEKCALLLLGWTLRLPRVPSSCRVQDTSALFPSSQISNISSLFDTHCEVTVLQEIQHRLSSCVPAADLQTSRPSDLHHRATGMPKDGTSYNPAP